ncbi:MAG: helix-turn-helix domain-containing protein [Coprobacillus sp.]|nr:helix-turn-helix domain-containing protein [Coprobacillus sp.]
MTDKEKIIVEHTRLAEEYSKLSNTSDLHTAKEWEAIRERMNEILVRIEELRKIEHTWEEFQTDTVQELIKPDMLDVEQIARDCNCSRQLVSTWLEIGIIRAIKTGKSRMVPREEYERFKRDYLGYDISNRIKAIKAFEVVNGG